MAYIEQCEKCGRDSTKCPHFNEELIACQEYQRPIDNSKFFSHFWSYKGRICRRQFAVTILIGYLIAQVFLLISGIIIAASGGDIESYEGLGVAAIFAYIPFILLLVLASIKRGHDIGNLNLFDYTNDDMNVSSSFIVFLIILIFRLFTLDELSTDFYILLAICGLHFLVLLFYPGEDEVNIHGTKPLQAYEEQIKWWQDE